jgi:hypothetical protein
MMPTQLPAYRPDWPLPAWHAESSRASARAGLKNEVAIVALRPVEAGIDGQAFRSN